MGKGARGGEKKDDGVNINNTRWSGEGRGKVRWIFVVEKYWGD